jgi:hypothetical protein
MTTQVPDRAARIAHKNAQMQISHDLHMKARGWAGKHGFSFRQQPFAAQVASRIKAFGGTPTAELVRSEVLRQWPDLEKV